MNALNDGFNEKAFSVYTAFEAFFNIERQAEEAERSARRIQAIRYHAGELNPEETTEFIMRAALS